MNARELGTARRMWCLDAPTATVDKGLALLGASGDFDIRFASFLIEHDRGLVLFDTGLDPRAATDAEDVYGERARRMSIRFTPEQRIPAQLEQLGFSVDDVTDVVLSHVHYDHVGGVNDFPGARLLVGEGELRYAWWPDPHTRGNYDYGVLERARPLAWTEVGFDLDLFGDGSVTAIRTPGHTPGHLSLVVRLPSRNFVLTGDCVVAREGLSTLFPMPFNVDIGASIRSVRKLLLIERSADATIWVGHDARDFVEHGGPCCIQ
jgi:glyoxylase-like metal-dependent hydrolase (beta-lactamase superfamily II)